MLVVLWSWRRGGDDGDDDDRRQERRETTECDEGRPRGDGGGCRGAPHPGARTNSGHEKWIGKYLQLRKVRAWDSGLGSLTVEPMGWRYNIWPSLPVVPSVFAFFGVYWGAICCHCTSVLWVPEKIKIKINYSFCVKIEVSSRVVRHG